VLEPDGTPARDFFTALNVASGYSSEQMLNIVGFSALYRWLRALYRDREQVGPEQALAPR
jgi:hypothetical protein